MTISKELLKTLASKNGIELDDKALDRFDTYAEKLIYWNERINLTAITDPEEIVYKHFLDSLMVLKYVDIPEGASLIDVGTGAGFPGLALLIARPDLKVTLMDSANKKLNVIRDILEALSLEANVVHARAEEAGQDPNFREQYDFSTARAVSNLRDLSEYCLPFVRKHGTFISMKGPEAQDELEIARKAIGVLGGTPDEPLIYDLEDKGTRAIVTIKKHKHTPQKYPRRGTVIKKQPI